ncbi:MAG: aquaporin family protein, partial [Bacteroidia bacterium]|nr:aquaporin family protein [Bacteroidia bacterium]
MTPFIAEVIGTFLLILLGNGVVANVVLAKTKGNNSGWIVITFGWALAVFTGVVVAGDTSGAHLNPAVTISLAAAGKFAWSQVGPYILAQMIGAMLGGLSVWLTYGKHYAVTPDPSALRATFCTTPEIRNPLSNIFSELVGTFVLVFAVLYFAGAFMDDGGVKQPIGLGAVGALPVAFIVFSIGLSLGGTTGYAINPARDLGPRIMHQLLPIAGKGDSDWVYSWIPVIGPILG